MTVLECGYYLGVALTIEGRQLLFKGIVFIQHLGCGQNLRAAIIQGRCLINETRYQFLTI